MTPLHAALLALTVAAALAAWSLARRDPRNRPVAWYLSAVVALDLLRWGRSVVLQPATGPRVGWELAARHVEAGLYLASILALPALAVAVFGGALNRYCDSGSRSLSQNRITDWIRRSRPFGSVALAWLLLTAGIVAGYPELRGAALMELYAAVEAVSAMVCLGCVVSWAWSGRAIAEAHTAPVSSALALIAGAAAVVLLDAVAVDWGGVVAANAAMVACVLVVQLRALCQAPRRARP